MPGYTRHFVYLPHSDFPLKSDEQKAEIKRLHAEQKKENADWNIKKAKAIILQGVGADGPNVNPTVPGASLIPTPVAIPARTEIALPKYAKECTLDLDPKTGNTVLLVASSKAGKTTIQMALYKKYFTKTISVLFAGSPQLSIYKQKNLIVTDAYEPDIVEIMRKLNKYSNNKFEFTCLFDDMISIGRDDTIQALFLSLRNSLISSIISLQYVNLMSKACRGNVNTIIGGSMNSDENILVFIKCYLLSYMRKIGLTREGDMIAYYRRLTENHGFVNISPSNEKISFCRLNLD